MLADAALGVIAEFEHGTEAGEQSFQLKTEQGVFVLEGFEGIEHGLTFGGGHGFWAMASWRAWEAAWVSAIC